MSLKNGTNVTKESIKIGNFEEKQKFHYGILSFKDISDIHKQGKIVEKYLKERNFLLLPRNEIVSNTNIFYTSLLLIWDNSFDIENVDKHKITLSLIDMFADREDVRPQGCFIFNNGLLSYGFDYCSSFTDENASYSYLITHQFVKRSYIYRITSSDSFKENLFLLKDYGIEKNTILDIVFTGRNTNKFHNCYSFNKFKVKDYYVNKDRGTVVISNVKGVLDLQKNDFYPANSVLLYNFLLDWKNPIKTNDIEYFSNMNLRIINFIPEDKVEIKDNVVLYKNTKMCGVTVSPINLNIIVCDNEEKRQELIEIFFSRGADYSIAEFIALHNSVEDIIKQFEETRVKKEKEEAERLRIEVINSIAQAKREKAEIEEQILLKEHRTKEFIPFPYIELPEHCTRIPVYDLTSILYIQNGKYFLKEEVNEDE